MKLFHEPCKLLTPLLLQVQLRLGGVFPTRNHALALGAEELWERKLVESRIALVILNVYIKTNHNNNSSNFNSIYYILLRPTLAIIVASRVVIVVVIVFKKTNHSNNSSN